MTRSRTGRHHAAMRTAAVIVGREATLVRMVAANRREGAGTGVAQVPRPGGTVTRPAYSEEVMNPPHENAPQALLVCAGTPE